MNGLVAMYQELVILSYLLAYSPHFWCHRCHTNHSVMINVLMTLVIAPPQENIAALHHSLILTVNHNVGEYTAG